MRSLRGKPNASYEVLDTYMTVLLDGCVAINDGRGYAIDGFSLCCLCGDRTIRKLQRDGSETTVPCVDCKQLQHKDCVSRLRSSTLCGISGGALVNHPSVVGIRVPVGEVHKLVAEGAWSHGMRSFTAIGQLGVDQYHDWLSTIPKRKGGHMMLKRVEEKMPKKDVRKAVDVSYERGKAAYRIVKTPVCACISRPPKRRKQRSPHDTNLADIKSSKSILEVWRDHACHQFQAREKKETSAGRLFNPKVPEEKDIYQYQKSTWVLCERCHKKGTDLVCFDCEMSICSDCSKIVNVQNRGGDEARITCVLEPCSEIWDRW